MLEQLSPANRSEWSSVISGLETDAQELLKEIKVLQLTRFGISYRGKISSSDLTTSKPNEKLVL